MGARRGRGREPGRKVGPDRKPDGPGSAAARALGSRPLVVVSNRLPVERRADGSFTASSGGLVAALAPILEATGGRWIGWDGSEVRGVRGAVARPTERPGSLAFDVATVPLTRADVGQFYYGFSNRTLWPLLHDLSRPPVFDAAWWKSYVEVNRRFAAAVLETTGLRDAIWVHDYHLMLAPGMIREARPDATILFFLHVPFPPPELWRRLPWRDDIARGLLGADLVGFQTEAHAENFRRAALAGATGAGWTREGDFDFGGRRLVVAAFPISTDFASWDALARTPEVERETAKLRERLGGRKVVLGVDRLDYTKGIPERLLAWEKLLEDDAEWRKRAVLIQVAVPSRSRVREYAKLKRDVDEIVGRVNGRFMDPETVRMPVHYLYRSVPRPRLASLYRAADVALVTPLKDGMNLVAKEYCAARPDEGGTLVLSEFAGAARELHGGAFLVNPFDERSVASALREALEVSPEEARERMRTLRAQVRENDVYRWAERLLARGSEASLESRAA